MNPLTARTYLEVYWDLSDPQSVNGHALLLNKFNGQDTIVVAKLQDTRPNGEWEEPESEQRGKDEVPVPELEKPDISTPDTSKTLRDKTMATMLQALLHGSDDNLDLVS